MKIVHGKYDIKFDMLGHIDFDLTKTLFFDIETTGFSAAHTKLYIIGCMYYDELSQTFKSKQWFLDDELSECTLLQSFFEFASGYEYIIHYNGEGFDLPYINHKCEHYIIDNPLKNMVSIDLYKIVNRLKHVLKLENLKQKTIEKFLNLNRNDIYSGGELIKVYEQYLKTHDENLFNTLLLHNYDDLSGLLHLSQIFNYKEFFDGNFYVKSISIENSSSPYEKTSKEVIIELVSKYYLPSRISGKYESFYMSAWHNTAKIKASVYTDELKFFYPNYKDYYYLPQEDRSIHKSIAFYVDKNYRTQAKAANCYSKKTGMFLPQYSEIISPYFKIEFFDKTTYFELTDEFLHDENLIKAFSLHVLTVLLMQSGKI